MRLFNEKQPLENGQTYTRWFLEDKIPDFWEKLSPVMRQALGDETALREFRAQVIQQVGLETQVGEESLKPEGVLQVYRRLAQFDKAGAAVSVTLAFDPRGAVARFEIRPVSASLR